MGRIRPLVPILAAALAAGSLGCATTPSPEDASANDRRARAHYRVAIEHLRVGRSALAIRELRAAENLDPDDAWIQLSLAEALTRQGRLDDAEVRLNRALEIKPDLHPARLNLTALYLRTERYAKAIQEADRLLDDPTFPVPWKALANQGWAQYKLGKAAEAREALELALEYHPEFWPAMLSLAVLDTEGGDKLEAIGGLERVLKQEPGPMVEAETNYRLAEIYISLGNRRKAVKHLTAASTQEPSGEWGKRSVEYLERLR